MNVEIVAIGGKEGNQYIILQDVQIAIVGIFLQLDLKSGLI